MESLVTEQQTATIMSSIVFQFKSILFDICYFFFWAEGVEKKQLLFTLITIITIIFLLFLSHEVRRVIETAAPSTAAWLQTFPWFKER